MCFMNEHKSKPSDGQMPNGEAIRCVCFDWGGVILRHCRSWAEACQYVGIPARQGMDAPEWQAIRRQINHDFQCGKIHERDFFPAIAKATNGIYSAEEVRVIHSGWLIGEYRNVGPLIEALNNRRGIETALLSNTNPAHWRRHQPTNFRPADFPTISMIKHRHASHLLGYAKPGIEIYKAFEKATGYRGAEILFFDDLPENIQAATSLGWHGKHVDHTQETAPQISAALAEYGLR